ncbi:MAG: PAS domain S-box protein, partial [Chloroflexales bacterium]|nr:PAS domain S-box protein [Chloroflexales bacterium]
MTHAPHHHDDEATPPADSRRAVDMQMVQAQLVGILTLTPHALIGADPQQRITLVNARAEALFGYSRQELLGQPLAVLLPQLSDDDALAGRPVVGPHMTTGVRRGGGTFDARAEIARVEVAAGIVYTIQVSEAHPSDEPLAASTLLDVVQDAVIVTDPALRIIGWNPAAEALYGWSAAEALGQSAYDLLRTDYLDSERPQLLQELQDRGVWKGEVVHHHRDGHPIVIMATVTWMRGPTGEPLGALSVNHDISALKEMEARLRAAATRLKVLADASRAFTEAGADLTVVLDRIVQATTDILGDGCAISLVSDDGRWLERVAVYSVDPHRLRLLREDNEHPQPLDAPLAGPRIVRTGQPIFLPVVDHERFLAAARPESRALWDQLAFHSMLGVPMRVQGRTMGIVTLFRHRPEQQPFSEDDLSLAQDLADRAALAISNALLFQHAQAELIERERAEQALRTSEAKLRAVFNSLVEGVVVLNPQGEVEEVNDAVQRLHGQTLEELADPATDPHWRIIRADGSPFPVDEQPPIMALRTGQAVRDIEMGVLGADGRLRWRIMNAQPVSDTDGTLLGAVASFFDITERKRAEQELRHSAERLQILAEASRAFAEAGTDYDTVLGRVARTLVPLMGEGCVIALISDDGAWLQASHVYDVDPELQELTRSLIGGRHRIEESTTNARVFQTGQPLLVPLVDRNQLRAAAKPEYAAMIERQGYHSLIVAPMRALGRVISVVTLYRRQSERPPFNADDLRLAQDLADRAATAIANARLYQQAQHDLAERQRAEQALET